MFSLHPSIWRKTTPSISGCASHLGSVVYNPYKPYNPRYKWGHDACKQLHNLHREMGEPVGPPSGNHRAETGNGPLGLAVAQPLADSGILWHGAYGRIASRISMGTFCPAGASLATSAPPVADGSSSGWCALQSLSTRGASLVVLSPGLGGSGPQPFTIIHTV